jgi:phosphohistidine phosphatase SixA
MAGGLAGGALASQLSGMRRRYPQGRRRRRWLPASAGIPALALALAIGSTSPATAQQMDAAADTLRQDTLGEPTIIYLVRHAETVPDGTRDPVLSEDGQARARWLAVILSHARLDAVYTTDYHRTANTAQPAAAANQVEPTVYDPSDLSGLAWELKAQGGRALVVGHSNTTPALVAALGGDGGPPIRPAEYDRLYTVVIRGDSVRTVMLRY